MNKAFSRYFQAVNFVEGLANLPPTDDYSTSWRNPEIYLKRMRYFLDLIGSPEKNFKIIHVAGTAGKGSVTDMIHETLSAAGLRVGSFSSPPVVSEIERIKCGKLYIAPDDFADIVEKLKPSIDHAYVNGPFGGPSPFELFLAIAFMYFKKEKCSWVVLEVGLGGRYDATNAIAHPKITAITSIDYDHTALLGKTLARIAADKAGIIKTGSEFYTAEQRPALLALFKKTCADNGAFFRHAISGDDHRERNKKLVAEIGAGIGLTPEQIKQGIEHSRLPCRFEKMATDPIVVLDGAHNRAKINATLRDLKKIKFRKLFLVLGISADKDHDAILRRIIPAADHVLITRFQNQNRKCAAPQTLAAKARPLLKKNAELKIFLDPHSALSHAMRKAKTKDLVLVTGSFFLAGEMRRRWYSEEKLLRRRKSF